MIEKIIHWCGYHVGLTIAVAMLFAGWGVYCLKNITIDAIPDLSETQVIIFTEWMGQSPDIIEDQITFPMVASMLAAPKVRVVRGQSMFGMSFVYVIFHEGTDLYWARSRVIEYLSKLSGTLPAGVTPTIGPDATGVGWIFQYALVDTSGQLGLAEIKTFQDWYLRYWLSSVPGVAEVASVGGFEKQYHVEVDPNKLAALNIPLDRVVSALKKSNGSVGGKTIEFGEREYYVRGLGYINQLSDLENASLGLGLDGAPIRVSDVGTVSLGPNIRRGVSDVNGNGDSVVGVVVMRQGEDAAKIIQAVKQKIEEVKPAFPKGLQVVPLYDREPLINEAVETLTFNIIEEILIVLLVIFLFLFHVRSTLVVVVTLPLSVLISFIPLYYLDISLNIMSMGGIILAVGDVVDGIVIFIENMHKKIATENDSAKDRREIAIQACSELGRSVFSAILIIAISFLPIFALTAEEGKLFHPLAYTKTFAMLVAALVSITITPALMILFVRGRIRPENSNPLNRWLSNIYRPTLSWCLKKTWVVLSASLLIISFAVFAFFRLGSEFMPPLWEGDLLYMPITVPGISITAATDLVHRQSQAIRTIPEVLSVFGKAGRFDSPTDSAPLSMLEFSIRLKSRDLWRDGLTDEKLIEELDNAVSVPGLNRAWTKPIRGRIDMLSTGIRTPVGIKIFGKDLAQIEKIGRELEATLSDLPGTRSAYAERVETGYYLDFTPDRQMIQRYGLNVSDVQMVVETAIGGMAISQTIEGRERYSISVRYPRELRDSVESIERILVPTATGAQVPLAELGKLATRFGPPMILSENGSLVGYVYIDLRDRDPGSYVNEAKEAVAKNIILPPGYFITWTGQYEYLERMQGRMAMVVPLTLMLIFGFLWFSMRSVAKTMLVMLSVPLSLAGAIFLLWALDYNTSAAIWAGAIALIGVAVEAASIVVIFLDQAWSKKREAPNIPAEKDHLDATLEGAGKSLRPVLMAVSMNLFGLIPVMVATGMGADVMKRISAPMFGGLLSLALLTLIVLPVVYHQWQKRVGIKKHGTA
jgi:Cu(I)/Ag(I) efflux system membrane protein CusA/SilA